MNKQFHTYIDQHYKQLLKLTKSLINNSTDDYRDICNEMICELLVLPTEKQQQLLDTSSVERYFNRMVRHSSFSPTSGYRKKYHQIKLLELIPEYDIPDTSQPDNSQVIHDRIKQIIDTHLNWYEKRILDIHINESKSYSKISQETSIPITSLFWTISTIKQKIKNKLDTNID